MKAAVLTLWSNSWISLGSFSHPLYKTEEEIIQLPNNIFELLTQLSDVFEKAGSGRAGRYARIKTFTDTL